MKKSAKKLALNRDTVLILSNPALEQAAAAGISIIPTVICSGRFSCNGTCAVSVCLPTCGNCTVLC